MVLPTIVDSLEITDEHRSKAVSMADTSHCDTDMGRDEEEHVIDSRIGVLGEILAREMIAETDDLTYEDPDDSKHDCYINGQRVEIKTRKTWNYKEPDLLIRKKFDLSARYYVQLDLKTESGNDPEKDLSNVITAQIVGFVKKSEVETYGEDFSPPGKKNDTVLVPRQKLRPMHELYARLA